MEQKMYCVPSYAKYILIYDPALDVMSSSALIGGSGAGGWNGGVAIDEIVYCVPWNSQYILKYDARPVTTTTTTATTTTTTVESLISNIEVPEIVGAGKSKWFGGVVISDKLYAVPSNANKIMIFDPATESVTSSATIPVEIDSGDGLWYGGVEIELSLYGFPGIANTVLIYNPATDAISSSALISDSIDLGDKQWSGGAVVLDVMYGCPYNANNVLIYDPGQGSDSEQISASAAIPSAIDGGDSQWAGGVTVDEILYCSPSNAKSILIYNPSLDTFSSAATADGGHPYAYFVSVIV